MTRPVLIIGGLGNGSVIAAAIKDAAARGHDEFEVAGYLNDREEVGSLIEDDKVLGKVAEAPKFAKQGYKIINTIYRIDGQDARIKLFEDLDLPDSSLATFVHPTAYVPGNIDVGPGTVLMPLALVSAGTRFGRCNLVMIGATIGHNNYIGDHCHFAAQCVVGAYLKIGEGVHVGMNSSIRENVTLGECSTLGMASTLLKSIPPYEVWAGSPAKKLRDAERELS